MYYLRNETKVQRRYKEKKEDKPLVMESTEDKEANKKDGSEQERKKNFLCKAEQKARELL